MLDDVIARAATQQAIATIVIAVATGALVGVTAWYAVTTQKLLKASREATASAERLASEAVAQRRWDMFDRQRRHAVEVSAWLESFDVPSKRPTQTGTVQIHNGGNQSIYQVHVLMRHPRFYDEFTSKGVVPPGRTHPKTDWTLHARPGHVPSGEQVGDFEVSVMFADADGRHWIRRHDGDLEDVTAVRRLISYVSAK